jgi:hypothetical protein
MNRMIRFLLALALITIVAGPVAADTFSFSSGLPDGKIAVASRPSGNGNIEIEAADDFVLNSETQITGASFYGLVPTGGATVTDVTVEIYRVFPNDSNPVRTPNVPTRTNSPSDVELDSRDSSVPNLSFTTTVLSPTFTAANSVLNGINPKPNSVTGGEGAITGEEVRFDVSFAAPFNLGADHYFFVPQVQLSNGDFYWLSAPRPIVAPGTPFTGDLQAWVRNENLAPDWLRVGTDIVGPNSNGGPAPTFNMAFSLTGTATAPEPSSALLLLTGVVGLLARRRRNA